MNIKKDSHLYKYLARYAFFGSLLFIIISICIFNHLWTGLGENIKTSQLPEITKNYEEFKDYATLIIALIAAIGSILSSLLIISFYGAWKDQHNKTIIADEARKTLIIFINISKKSKEIQNILDKSAINEYLKIENIVRGDAFKEFLYNIDLVLNDLKYFLELTQDDENILYEEFQIMCNDYKEFLDKNKNKEMTNILEGQEKVLRLKINEKNNELRMYLKKYILLN